MPDDTTTDPLPHEHHGLRERLDAAEAAADEVVADGSGQLSGEVSALAVPFEEAIAAVRAALHPSQFVARETVETTPDDPEQAGKEAQP